MVATPPNYKLHDADVLRKGLNRLHPVQQLNEMECRGIVKKISESCTQVNILGIPKWRVSVEYCITIFRDAIFFNGDAAESCKKGAKKVACYSTDEQLRTAVQTAERRNNPALRSVVGNLVTANNPAPLPNDLDVDDLSADTRDNEVFKVYVSSFSVRFPKPAPPETRQGTED